MNWLVEDKDNPRLALLDEVMEGVTSKVAIVYSHSAVGSQLAVPLPGCGASARRHAPGQRSTTEKDRFNMDPQCRVILLQADASKYGHTLLGEQTNPADRCSTMIFYQNSYSLDTRTQIEDRIHRIGQNDGCLVCRFRRLQHGPPHGRCAAA